MSVLAIDPGMGQTGYCYEMGDQEVSGVIKTNQKESHDPRINKIVTDLRAILMFDAAGPFEELVIEFPVFTFSNKKFANNKPKNADSLLLLSQVVGAIRSMATQEGLIVRPIPSTWNQLNKKQATDRAGVKNHNEADAILLFRWWEERGQNAKWCDQHWSMRPCRQCARNARAQAKKMAKGI